MSVSLARSFVHPFTFFLIKKKRSSVHRENFSSTRKKNRRREHLSETTSGRRDRFRQKIIKIGAILAIFEPFEVRKFRTPYIGEFGRSSQDLSESDYDSPKSWDDWLNSCKNGMSISGDWNTQSLLFATQVMSCFEHTECLASNKGKVLLRTHGMSCFEHAERPAWNTRNVLLGTQDCPAWNIENTLQRLAIIDSSCIVSSSDWYVGGGRGGGV